MNTSFLNEELKKVVYMMLPEGLNIENSNNKIWKLKKVIYRLKQSFRSRYEKVERLLCKLDYTKSKLEPCLFTKIKNNLKTSVSVYVDFFVFSND